MNKKITKSKENRNIKIALFISIIGSLPFTVITVLRCYFVEYFDLASVFLLDLLFTTLIVLTIFCFFIYFIFIVIKSRDIKAIIPVIVALLLLFASVKAINLVQNLNFYFNFNKRMEVVRLVELGKLKVERMEKLSLDNTVKLPNKYKHLSTHGKVDVVKSPGHTEILFLFPIGGYSNSGFLYKQDNNKPIYFKYMINYSELQKLRSHWFLAPALD